MTPTFRTARPQNVVSSFVRGGLCLIVAACLFAGCSTTLNKKVPNDIRTQMKRLQPEFLDCYAEALERQGELEGTMTLTYLVDDKTGTVSNIAVTRSEIKDKDLEQCVVEQAKGIEIEPAPNRPVRVNYPIAFSKHQL